MMLCKGRASIAFWESALFGDPDRRLSMQELDISKHVYSLSMRRGMFVWRNRIPDGFNMGHRRDSGLYQSPLRCDQVTGDSDS